MKILTVFTAGMGPRDNSQIRRLQLADQHPRVLLFEDRVPTDILGPDNLGRLPRPLRFVVRRLPALVRQALAAYSLRSQYDAVLTWEDQVGIVFALINRLSGASIRHVALIAWVSASKKRWLLKRVHQSIDRIVMWSSVQRELAVRDLRIPESKVLLVPHFVDQQFWRPLPAEGPPCVCAVGNEMRDYPTLIKAVRGSEIPCHIAARQIVARSRKLSSPDSILASGPIPANVVVEAKPVTELRELYARSRFVVIPLQPTDSDNGVTTILEAMAMGKAVICSKVQGQVDVIEHGKNGLFVPQGDPQALRAAILDLWQHPELAERMGLEGRRLVEERHTLDQFVEAIRAVVIEVVGETSRIDSRKELSGERLQSR